MANCIYAIFHNFRERFESTFFLGAKIVIEYFFQFLPNIANIINLVT